MCVLGKLSGHVCVCQVYQDREVSGHVFVCQVYQDREVIGHVCVCQVYQDREVSGHVFVCQVYQDREVSGHVFVCQVYPFCLFLRIFNRIFELFRHFQFFILLQPNNLLTIYYDIVNFYAEISLIYDVFHEICIHFQFSYCRKEASLCKF